MFGDSHVFNLGSYVQAARPLTLAAIAGHESPRTTKLYNRTKERLTQDEVERIRL